MRIKKMLNGAEQFMDDEKKPIGFSEIEHNTDAFPTTLSLFEAVFQFLFSSSLTSVQRDMIYALSGEEGYPKVKDLMIMAWRGAAKSLITSVYVIDLLYRDPSLKILIMSARPERAKQVSEFIKRVLLGVDQLRFMLPFPYQRRGTKSFDISTSPPSHMPSIMSVGILQAITGFRADVIICDDIEIFEEKERDIKARLIEALNLLTPNGRVIFLGTYQKKDSIYRELYPTIIQAGYFFPLLLPCRTRKLEEGWSYGRIVTKLLDEGRQCGEPYDERFQDIERLKERIPEREFKIQYLLEWTTKEEDITFVLTDLVVAKLPDYLETPPTSLVDQGLKIRFPYIGEMPVLTPVYSDIYENRYFRKIMVIDPSGTGTLTDTAFVVLGVNKGKLYFLDYGASTDGFSETVLTAIAVMAKKWNVSNVFVEANFAGGMFMTLLSPILFSHHICALEKFSTVTNQMGKIPRILSLLTPMIVQKRLIFSLSVLNREADKKTLYENASLLSYQLSELSQNQIPKKTDVVDALSSAIKILSPLLGMGNEEIKPQMRISVPKYIKGRGFTS